MKVRRVRLSSGMTASFAFASRAFTLAATSTTRTATINEAVMGSKLCQVGWWLPTKESPMAPALCESVSLT